MFINKSMSMFTCNYLGQDYGVTNPSQMAFALYTGTPPTAAEFMAAAESQRFIQSNGEQGNICIKDLLSYIENDLGHQRLGTARFSKADDNLWDLVNEDFIEFDSSFAPEESFVIEQEGTAGFLLTLNINGASDASDLPNNTSFAFHINMARVNTPANGGEVQISDTNITFDKVVKLSSIKFRIN